MDKSKRQYKVTGKFAANGKLWEIGETIELTTLEALEVAHSVKLVAGSEGSTTETNLGKVKKSTKELKSKSTK